MSGDSLNLVEILQIEPFSKTACSQIPNLPEGFGFGFGGSLDDKALVCRENECYTIAGALRSLISICQKSSMPLFRLFRHAYTRGFTDLANYSTSKDQSSASPSFLDAYNFARNGQ